MPDKKNKESVDSLLVEGASGTFQTSFNTKICEVINLFIADRDGVLNYISYKQGELVIELKDYMKERFYIDSEGCLIVVGENANKFSINNIGQLIYTY
jgi:hypothetical protein